MPLSLDIPSKGSSRRKSLNSDESPTTATNERSGLMPGKINLSASFSKQHSGTNLLGSPTTAVSTSPTLLVPRSPANLSRRGSFAADSEGLPGDIEQVLQTLPFFAGAPNTQPFIKEIGTAMKIRHFKPGDTVIHFGDAAKCMFLIIKYATLSSGSFVGEIGVLFNTVRTATVVSKTKSILAALTVDVLESKLEIYPDIRELLQVKGRERLQALEMIKNNGGVKQTTNDAKEAGIQRQPSFKAGYIVPRSSSFLALNPDASVNHNNVSPTTDNGGFLALPDQMDVLKSRSGSRRSSINPESFNFEDVGISLIVPEPRKLSRSNSKKSNVESDDDYVDFTLSKSAARRKSSIRFDLSSLLQPDDPPISIQVIDDADRCDSPITITVPDITTPGISIENEENSIQILVPQLSVTSKEDTPKIIAAIAPDIQIQVETVEPPKAIKIPEPIKISIQEPSLEVRTAPVIVASPEEEEAPCSPKPTRKSEELKGTRVHDKVAEGTRRISVAVWSDPKLLQQAQKKEEGLTGVTAPGRRWSVEMIANLESPAEMDEDEREFLMSESSSDESILEQEAVLELVFKYLDFKTLLKFRQCCRSISEIIVKSKPKALKDIDLSMYYRKITDKSLIVISRFCGQLIERLNLHACWQLSDRGIDTMAKSCPELNMLRLSEVWEISDHSASTIAKHCQHLTFLDLSNCRKITNAGIFNLLEGCKVLKSISLSYCKNLSNSMLNHEGWIRIENLNFQRCTGIADRGFENWTTLVENDDMWVQSRSIANSREWQRGSDEDKISQVGDLSDYAMDRDFDNEELFSEPGSAEELSHEMSSKDDISQFSSKEWGYLGSPKSDSNDKIVSLKEEGRHKSTSFTDLSSIQTPNKGSNSGKVSEESLHNNEDPDDEFSNHSPSSNSKSTSLPDIGPRIFVQEVSQVDSGSGEDSSRSCAFALRQITLRDCSFLTDSTIASIASVCGHLRILNLSFCCSLSEDFARHLVKGCSKLSRLDVSYCGGAITDHTLLHLSTGLTKLTALSIRGCIQVTDVGIDHLYENARSLEILNATQCKSVSPETLAKLSSVWTLLDTESVCEGVCEWTV